MIGKTYTFSNNYIADPAQVNQNFDDLIASLKSAHHRDEDGALIAPADIATGWGLVPSNGVIMFHGLVADIPAGYLFCNGASGTPDLREKFVVGVNADAGSLPLNSAGGEATHTLIIAEIPVHSHFDDHCHSGRSGNETALHTHYDSGHGHSTNENMDDTVGDGYPAPGNSHNQKWQGATGVGYANMGGESAYHQHDTTVNYKSQQGFGATTVDNGGGATHNNMPPYYALVFIKKT